MTDLKYWLWLTLALKQKSRKITALLERFETPLAVYRAEKSDFHGLPLSPAEAERLCDKSLNPAESVIAQARAEGVRIMTFDSPYYPHLLANIFDPPYVLYVKSRERLNLNDALTISIVGTRHMTSYGREAAVKIGADLARCGVVVVSGMARGIDGAAMTGALDAGGKVVAVLGCGLDVVYPPEHAELMKRTAQNGMVISEYPFGSPPSRMHFPVRNRIISGLSAGTVVVESSAKGGSLITANQALEQGRDVFAVPGNINRPYSDGANELIRQGAHLVSSALDILSEYRDEYIHIFEKAVNNEQQAPKNLPPAFETKEPEAENRAETAAVFPAAASEQYASLSPEEKRIVDVMSLTPSHVDTLAEKTGLSASELNASLTLLEMKGLIAPLAGRHYILNI